MGNCNEICDYTNVFSKLTLKKKKKTGIQLEIAVTSVEFSKYIQHTDINI